MRLADVLDWAERNTASTVLSCLAAHAGVLHSDGIARHRSARTSSSASSSSERSGDHDSQQTSGERIRFPHSRWNEVQAEALTSAVIGANKIGQAGVDLFVKQRKKSLFVHFQGHPEYGAQTLLKEYRRDIRRFLRAGTRNLPHNAHGYFDAAAAQLLDGFSN